MAAKARLSFRCARGHWGGGLFDFFGQDHSDGDRRHRGHWNNDWHGSYDWRD
jgi:hypothetical protein